MTYKIKSSLYLASFILAAIVYYNISTNKAATHEVANVSIEQVLNKH